MSHILHGAGSHCVHRLDSLFRLAADFQLVDYRLIYELYNKNIYELFSVRLTLQFSVPAPDMLYLKTLSVE